MKNETIIATRLAAFNLHHGPRVGDFLALAGHARCPSYTRFTHDWGDWLQTGGLNGSYYLGSGYLSYSGSLDRGISKADCLPTDEVKPGSLWIFDQDIHQAHNGVNCEAPMRVFTIRPGADTSGIEELQCPYFLVVADDEMRKRNNSPYRYLVYHHATNHIAFEDSTLLLLWLDHLRLALSKPLSDQNQRLAYL